MKLSFSILIGLILTTSSCSQSTYPAKNSTSMKADSLVIKNGYSPVNGIQMYYEIYGQGEPLVLIHGGGSTIQTSFERVIPQLAMDFKVIAMDLQNHGRSGFRDAPETFEQDAEDVATLLKNLEIEKAYFFGFSNGGHTAIEIYFHHPEIVKKLILGSSPYSRDCFVPGFFDGFKAATLENMPQPLKQAFLKVNPDTMKLQMMFEKDRDRMRDFKGWSDKQLTSIKVPTLILAGEADVITPACVKKMHDLISNSEMAILPGGHGKYIGEIAAGQNVTNDSLPVVPLIREFLHK